MQDFAAQAESANSNTTKEQLIREFGEDRYKEHPDGSWTVRLDSVGEVEKFDEMDRPRQRKEIEMRRKQTAKVETVVLRDREGREFRVESDRAEFASRMAERNGVQLHERPYWGKRRSR